LLADLCEADLSGTNLADARLDGADLRNVNLTGSKWRRVNSVKLANFFGAKGLPPDFARWAAGRGAVFIESDDQWSTVAAIAEPKK
jgi:uncharacterized protein YjbI with pentapeptide repeats